MAEQKNVPYQKILLIYLLFSFRFLTVVKIRLVSVVDNLNFASRTERRFSEFRYNGYKLEPSGHPRRSKSTFEETLVEPSLLNKKKKRRKNDSWNKATKQLCI